MPLIDASQTYQMTNPGAHIDATEVSAVHPNLLDNWYFVGGGSQNGDGYFPINQRGLSSYNGGYGIDRWRCWQVSTTTLTASGLTFATGTSGDGLFQYFPRAFWESLYGKTVTVSAIINGQLYSATGVASADCWIAVNFDGDNYVGYICNGNDANFRVVLEGAGRSATIQAVKLELGTVSTLANDAPPNFGEELAKCQRYLFIRDYGANEVIANGVSNNVTMFLPVSMRSGGSPQMTLTVTPLLIGYGIVSTPTSVAMSSLNGNQVQIYVPTNESHANTAVSLYASTALRLTISNEL